MLPALDTIDDGVYRHSLSDVTNLAPTVGEGMPAALPGMRGISSVRSVERAMEILTALSKAETPLSITEIAQSVELPYATVQRLLLVHERLGFVQKDRHLYRLGPGVVTLAGAYLAGDGLIRAAQPVLDELAQFSEETVSLHVRQGPDRVVVMWRPSVHPLGYVFQIGQRRPLLLGAAGYVLCSDIPTEERKQLLRAHGELLLADGTVLPEETWFERVDEARQQGYSVSWGDSILGAVTVAAPVRKSNGEVLAAVLISAAQFRITDEKLSNFALAVRQAGQQIARLHLRG